MTPELVVAPVATFVCVSLLFGSMFAPKRNEAAAKLKPYGYRSAQDADNLDRPFSERVVFPALERIGRIAGSTAPKQVQQRFQAALDEAGNPISINSYLALRGMGMFGLPLLYLLLALSLHADFGLIQVGMLALFSYIGSYLPKRWVRSTAERRQKNIERALPDALDLIVVSMEAGLALDGAIAKVVEKTKGPLKQELQRTLQEIQLGKPRREALRDLGHRTKVKQLIALVNAIVQADQMGVAMAQVMRTQADEARIKRRQRAEEKAHQAAVKMLFPLVLFILPCVMVVTVGPAAIEIYRQFSAGLLG